MKRLLGLILALTVMVGMSTVPSFAQNTDQKTDKTDKDKKAAAKKTDKSDKDKKDGKKKGAKKDDKDKKDGQK